MIHKLYKFIKYSLVIAAIALSADALDDKFPSIRKRVLPKATSVLGSAWERIKIGFDAEIFEGDNITLKEPLYAADSKETCRVVRLSIKVNDTYFLDKLMTEQGIQKLGVNTKLLILSTGDSDTVETKARIMSGEDLGKIVYFNRKGSGWPVFILFIPFLFFTLVLIGNAYLHYTRDERRVEYSY